MTVLASRLTINTLLCILLLISMSCRSFANTTLAVNSPLAASDDRIFAVATDRHTLLSRLIGKDTGFEKLVNAPNLKRVTGLAANAEHLFVSDGEAGMVYKLPLQGGAYTGVNLAPVIIHPGELALASAALFVADIETGAVASVNIEAANPEPLRIFQAKSGHHPIYLATDGDELVLAGGEGNLLLRFKNTGESNHALLQGDIASIQLLNSNDHPKLAQETPSRSVYRGSENGDYPQIPQPGAISIVKGLVYVVGGDAKLYVTPRLFTKAVEIPLVNYMVRPSRVLATEDRLFVLDGTTGELVDWVRPVATEFVVEQRASECATAIYSYLNRSNLLPVRDDVLFEESYEKTLKREGALLGAYPDALNEVMCTLNPSQCLYQGKSLAPRKGIQSDEKTRIPNLFAETTLAYRRISLKASETVGDVVDSAVTSAKFAEKRSPTVLCDLNPIFARKSMDCLHEIRQQQGGDWVLPQEILRYVGAVPVDDLQKGQPRGMLLRLAKQCPKMLINPLEHRPSNQSACPQTSTADKLKVDIADQSLQQLARVIHYPEVTPHPAVPVEVTVAESAIDFSHLDFSDGNGNSPFYPYVQTVAISPISIDQFVLRPFDMNKDHGTAVSYLIVGQRHRGISGGLNGLSPGAKLVPLTTRFDEIHQVFSNSPNFKRSKIVNLSSRSEFGNEDAGLGQLLRDNDQVLFVVAAGNTGETRDYDLCRLPKHFFLPTCRGDQKNVLVVAATNLDGTEILKVPVDNNDKPCGEGSIFDSYRKDLKKFVHVAAPGENYFSAGAGAAYVPVRGTSFATPLVTATASLLMGQGVTDAAMIKRRIIASSEPFKNKDEAQKVLGGLLHVENAIRWPFDSAITITGQNEPLRAQLLIPDNRSQIYFRTTENEEIPIAWKNLLRIKKQPNDDYWVAYLNDVEDVRVRYLRISSDVDFTYQPLNDKGAPQGDARTLHLNELKDFIAPVYGL